MSPKRLERCIAKVKKSNKGSSKKVNPYAVCQKATGLKMHRGKKK